MRSPRNYPLSDTAASPIPIDCCISPPTVSSEKFYFVTGGLGVKQTILVTAKIDNIPVEAFVTYSIDGPSNVAFNATISTVQDADWDSADNLRLSLGTIRNLPSSAGIQFKFCATGASTTAGYLALAQQVENSYSETLEPSAPPDAFETTTPINEFSSDGCAFGAVAVASAKRSLSHDCLNNHRPAI